MKQIFTFTIGLLIMLSAGAQEGSQLKETEIVTVVDLGSAPNPILASYSGNQLWSDTKLGVIINIHNLQISNPDTSTNNVGFDISFDNGLNWSANNILYQADTLNEIVKCPQGAIFNPDENTNLENSYYFFIAGIMDSVTGLCKGILHGRMNLSNFDDTIFHYYWSDTSEFLGIPKAMTMASDGNGWLAIPEYKIIQGEQIYQHTFLMMRFEWNNQLLDFELNTFKLDVPLPGTGYPFDEQIAFSHPNPSYGYLSILGNDTSISFSEGTIYPIIFTTGDYGNNWDKLGAMQLGGEDGVEEVVYNFLTDEQLEELFEPPVPEREDIVYTLSGEHDIVVDRCGDIHITAIVGLKGTEDYTMVTSPWSFGAFQLYSYHQTNWWVGNRLGICQNFEGNIGNSGNFIQTNRPQASVNEMGCVYIGTWQYTQLEDTLANNSPDIFARGFEVGSNMITTDESGEDMPNNVTAFCEGMWQAYFAVTSQNNIFDGGNSEFYRLPMTYLNIDPLNPALEEETQVKYIQDFMYSSADFTVESNNEHPYCWECYTSIFDVKSETIHLLQNTPNPFSSSTSIQFATKERQTLILEVYSLTGQKVYEQHLGFKNPGTHEVILNAEDFDPGIYFYSLIAGGEKVSRKMIVQ